MMNPHILVLNQYYPPDSASTGRYVADVCEYLAQQGARVSVITATPSYAPTTQKPPLIEKKRNLDVYRVPLGILTGRTPLSKRVAGYVAFLLRAKRLTQHVTRSFPPDAVLCFHNPPFLPAVALPAARKARAPFFYCPQDIYPDILTLNPQFPLPKTFYKKWQQWHQRVLENADHIIVLSDDMRKTLSDKGINPGKITVIPPWCSLAPIEPEKRLQARRWLGVQNSLLAVYTGNIGFLQPLSPLLQTASLLKRENILFFIVGDGMAKHQNAQRKCLQNIWNVQFFPFQYKQDYERLLTSADIGVLCLRKGAERLSMPSRMTSYLASGLPVLAFMSSQGETAHWLRNSQSGWVCPTPQEARSLLLYLQSHKEELIAYSIRALQTAQEHFSPEKNLALYGNLFQQTLRTTRPQASLTRSP
jgi:glycosyltransferase involved in cell wall biosynthesis